MRSNTSYQARLAMVVIGAVSCCLADPLACVGAGDSSAQPALFPGQSRAAVKEVRYEDFGARGDGVADDSAALAKAHEHANRERLPVRATDGASYRIGGANRTIPIETDTNFGTARFVIDDTQLENINAHVFVIRSTLVPAKITGVTKLARNQAQIETRLPGPCVVIATNQKVQRFIRRGTNANTGAPQTDVFLVDRDGGIHPKTPIVWNFDEITSLQALPVDERTLTIRGGRFTTIANRAESNYNYHARGIAIRRSNVVIDGLEHLIEGEGVTGAPYYGFLDISDCANVEVRNTVLTSHKTYSTVLASGRKSLMGSYDLTLTRALNVSLVNCTQSNGILEARHWGIMGSNFCKNLTYDRCKLSRFDAHQGVTNATIRDSVIGSGGIQLTGAGTFLIENSTVQSGNFIDLRRDYGSTWDGVFIIRNCRFEPPGKLDDAPSLIAGRNDGQHDFGYPCQMPACVTIETLHVDDRRAPRKAPGPALFGNFSPQWTDASYHQPYPYGVARKVVLKGITTASRKPVLIGNNPFMFRDVEVSGDGG